MLVVYGAIWARNFSLVEQQLLMIICCLWRYVADRVLVNKTVHRSNASLFTVFMDAT
jgi:hypothetical protein